MKPLSAYTYVCASRAHSTQIQKCQGEQSRGTLNFTPLELSVMPPRSAALLSPLEPVVGSVAHVSFSVLSTEDFQMPLGAIRKGISGKGPAVFSLSSPEAGTTPLL